MSRKPSAQALLPQLRIYAETAPQKALALCVCETPEQFLEFATNCKEGNDGDGFMLASLLLTLKPSMRAWVIRQSGGRDIAKA